MDFRKFSTAPALLDADIPDTIYACPDCSDTGWNETGGVASRCACRPRQQHADDVPFEFQAATFATFAVEGGNRTALTRALEFVAKTTARDLYLCGGVGAGKSRLGCSILNEAHIKDPRVGWFVRVPMMLYRLQPGTGLSDDDRIAYEHRLFHAPLICLDDLGAERDVATDFTRRMLLMIYEERGDKGLRTIWTSNKTLGELSAMQDDDRLTSRIVGRADVVNLSTADQRRARRGR